MNRRHPSHSQPLATYLTGLTLIILLCALVSGGALRASHTVTVNPQFTVELQHLVAVSHIEKIRVESPMRSQTGIQKTTATARSG